ncbi:hypothetical protein ACFL4O_01590 [bacterium]
MKKITTLVLCMFLLTGLAQAKGYGKGPRTGKCADKEWSKQRHKEHVEKLAQELDLSEDQKEKVSEILKNGWEKINKEKEQMIQRVKEIRNKKDSSINSILNDEQKKKFEEYKKERKLKREKIKHKMKKKMKHKMKKKRKKKEGYHHSMHD